MKKLHELISLLLARTRSDQVIWEWLPEDTAIRSLVGKGIVRIACESVEVPAGAGAKTESIFRVWITDSRGRHLEDFVVTPLDGQEAYATTLQLFQTARESARNTNAVLNDMIHSLKAGAS